ncbi:DUF1758 domain-containing protein [Trichonephila clavipes]|nr:DUF1758 domain-containing protein [Trichonephila clavipes]
MGCIPLRKEILMHSLFGGIKSDKCEHTCYRIRLRNQDNSVTCNLEALDQTSICDNIASVSPGSLSLSWISELNEMNIQLSDVGEESRSIQVLLGSDVIGKLMTGQRRILSCGLVAMETILGWTLSGKVPDSEISSCNSMLVASLFVKEMDISQLWRLDSLEIHDPSEQKTKEELHKASMEPLRTVKVDEEERFLVSLPWLDNHLPQPDNFNLVFKGLQVTTHKLKKENLFEEYGDVFKEWKREGIIEEFPKEELKSVSHYLPHRHVLKLSKNCYNISTLPCLEHRLKYLRKRRGVFNKGRCNKSNDGCGESNSTVPKNSADEKNSADGAKLCTNETEPSATVDENDGKRDLAVAVDGSWQKRGFSSKNGLVTVTSVDTGKVIDVEVFSKHCICPNKTKHLQNCKRNFEGYSGKMEVAGALSIFQRSQSFYNVRYTKYLGDGDSKALLLLSRTKVYGDHCSVEKLECIGHVLKRMGTRLRRLKTKMRGQKTF